MGSTYIGSSEGSASEGKRVNAKALIVVGVLAILSLLLWELLKSTPNTPAEVHTSTNATGIAKNSPSLIGDDQPPTPSPDALREEPRIIDPVRATTSEASSEPASLKGRVAIPPGGHEALVKLFVEVRSSGGHGLQGLRGQQTDTDGDFLFSEVNPGPYLVTAFWQSGPAEYSLAREGVELEPGEHMDIGLLDAWPGSFHEVMVGFRRETGDDGEWVPLEQLFSPDSLSDGLRHHVDISCRGEGPPDFLGRFGIITEVPIGEPFYLRGLYPGSWSFFVPPGITHLPQPDRPFSLSQERLPVRVEIPYSGVIELPIAVTETFAVELRIEQAHQYGDLSVFSRQYRLLVLSRESESEHRSLQISCSGDACSKMAYLRAGSYLLLLVPEGVFLSEGTYSQASYFALHEFTVGENGHENRQVIDIRPETGATLQGAGAEPGALVYLHAEGLLGIDVFGISWTRADEEGSFMFPGLVPNVTYRIKEADQTVKLGDPGTSTEVSLR